MGKWMGFAIMITLYLILTGVGTLVLLTLFASCAAQRLTRSFAHLANCLLLLAVSFFGAIFSTITNGVMVFDFTASPLWAVGSSVSVRF